MLLLTETFTQQSKVSKLTGHKNSVSGPHVACRPVVGPR